MLKAFVFLLLAASFSGCTQPAVFPEPPTPLRYLALGDSYTIGESVATESRWPVQLTAALQQQGLPLDSLHIIARTGWRTDELLAAVGAQNLSPDWDLVSLLIGVNNFYQGRPMDVYEAEFRALLDTAVFLAGARPDRVLVVSIPDYAYTPFGAGLPDPLAVSNGIDSFNAVNRRVALEKNVTWMNITDLSRRGLAEPALVALDGLHPSGLQYNLWVQERLAPAAGLLLAP
ncbi:MAG: SGNH/GDSL hydrolase family protein [Bacteroidetes bacterium]|nr:SGNH/GDSL hydrolase family protein [Bacteroidota bacterium]